MQINIRASGRTGKQNHSEPSHLAEIGHYYDALRLTIKH